MKNVCSECGSERVQGKVWVSLNDPKQIDYSPLEDADNSEYWCEDCKSRVDVELVENDKEE